MSEENISNGDKIRLIRKELGLNQMQMSQKLGIKQSYYSNIESNKKNASNNVINKLINVLNVSPSWFYTGEGNIFSPTEEDALRKQENFQKNNFIKPNSHEDYIDNISDSDILLEAKRELAETVNRTKAVMAHLGFTRNFLVANDIEKLWSSSWSDITTFSQIHSILMHYSLEEETFGIYEKYLNQKAELSEVLEAYKKAISDMNKLKEILSPYENIIKEIKKKLELFDEAHDAFIATELELLKSDFSEEDGE